ncbi:MAG: formylglycine-generating enzyme family protein [bacterium]|nr:formylglycine-generating enzyme family protein [bacterium]
MRILTIRILLSVALIMVVGARASRSDDEVVFTDSVFPAAHWQCNLCFDSTPGGNAEVTVEQRLEGGNPGEYRYTHHEFTGPGGMIIAHLNSTAIYDPGLLGPISTIDLACDAFADPFAGYGLLLMQGGKHYWHWDHAVENQDWVSHVFDNLTPEDFSSLPSEPGPEYPVFSREGMPITLGYFTSNACNAAIPQCMELITSDSGIDNWTVVIHKSPANTPPVISDVSSIQRVDDSGLVDITFDLFDADGDAMTLQLFLSEDGGATFPVECLLLTPPPGSSFTSGSNRSLIWDARLDYAGHEGEYHVRIQVNDSQYSPPDTFVLIPAGGFTMGSPEDELGRDSDEVQHEVILTTSFSMQNTEVTNQQYAGMVQWAYDHDPPLVIASSSSLQDNLDGSTEGLLNLNDDDCMISFSGGIFIVDSGKENHPVMEVTWFGSARYCDWLSLIEGLPRAYEHSGDWSCNGGDPYGAQGYRLPTEAEWEYACRAMSTTAFANGPITYTNCSPLDSVLDVIGWYCGNHEGWTSPVGQKISNAWGLYDMHGNLYEWCNDWYGSYNGDETDPTGLASGDYRVIRGGYWYDGALLCRSACQGAYGPSFSSSSIGFRPVVRSTN